MRDILPAMSTVDTKTLEDFAAICRRALEGLATRPGSTFQGFPVASCGPAAELVGRALEERLGLKGAYVCGSWHPLLREQQTHAWFEVAGNIIDLTHDQFEGTGLQGWVLPASSPWHTQFEDQDRRDGHCMPSGWPMYPHDGYEAIRRALDAGAV